MDNFFDTSNYKDILIQFRNLKDVTKIQAFIQETYPTWLVMSLERYCDDYPHLQTNWKKVCDLANVKPQKIVLVEDIKFDSDHNVIREFAEYMTKNGYIVRRAGEFIACGKCMAAIPCEDVWKFMKQNKLPVPKIWSNTCSNCL